MRRLIVCVALLAWTQSNASLEEDGVWKAGVWNTTVWGEGVWREGEGDPPDPIPTIGPALNTVFTDTDVTGAVFRAGTAYTNSGNMYVRECDPPDVYVRGIGHSHDGAMCIDPDGSIDVDLAGWALTNEGEVVAEECEAVSYANGIPRGESHKVCMTDID